MNEPETRSGFVSLLGATNAGKSTLVNQLVGTKVSIVSHKVQTTRSLIRGIVVEDKCQMVLVDTPGIFTPRRRLDRAMISSAWAGARDADIVLFIVDAERGFAGDAGAILDSLKDSKHRNILVLNKVDRVEPPKLLDMAAYAANTANFEKTFMISALKGSGCKDLMKFLSTALPNGPWYYPEDQVSDLPMRNLAAEITREKLYDRLHQELPYHSHVETEKWEEMKNGDVRIQQVIYVERESQRKIVLGHKGETIKAIGQSSRLELAGIIEQKVHLFLFVKVRENWGDDPERFREMGLDFSA